MNIAIIGVGSIGSYVAAMFAQYTDHHLYLLARTGLFHNFSLDV